MNEPLSALHLKDNRPDKKCGYMRYIWRVYRVWNCEFKRPDCKGGDHCRETCRKSLQRTR